jgi:hypothetical protein
VLPHLKAGPRKTWNTAFKGQTKLVNMVQYSKEICVNKVLLVLRTVVDENFNCREIEPSFLFFETAFLH